ncbi:MAG: type III pantothenate kinase [Ruthenibacterium sp.]
MVLTIDIGNTNLVMGGYTDGVLVFSTRIATDRSLESDQYALQLDGILHLHGIDSDTLEGAILSSVVPQLTDTLMRALQRITPVEPLLFSQSLHTGVRVKIDRPAELGSDLLAGVIGAKAHYPLPAVVIDMGTATKITAVDGEGAVLGCSIAPGVFVSLNALTGTAVALGGIAVKAPVHGNAIGTNTADSMQSGVVYGAAAMLDGMIDRFAAELGAPASILATGGAAGCIVPHCSHRVQLVPTLILDGLYAVYQANR